MPDTEIKILDLQNPTNPKNYVDRPYAKGTPLYWGDDQTGRLRVAVMAYHLQRADGADLQLVIAYTQYHIHAPCWLETFEDADALHAAEVNALRKMSLELKTIEDLNEYIDRAMGLALDPL